MSVSSSKKKDSEFIIAPSLLAANFLNLAQEVNDVQNGGANWLHLDVMDGHFVPNLTFGPWLVEILQPIKKIPLDCHLMVSEPEKWIAPFANAGADWITIHAEATCHLNRILNQIRDLGCKAGVSINPGTSLSFLEEVLDHIDLVLIMSVNPGWGGQKFIHQTFSKIERLQQMRGDRDFLIQVDGGINISNIGKLAKSGADAFVIGSALFSQSDRKMAMTQLRAQLKSFEN